MRFIEAVGDTINALCYKHGFWTTDGRMVDFDAPIERKISAHALSLPNTIAHPCCFLTTVTIYGIHGLLLSYGYVGSTFCDRVIYTDQPEAEQPICSTCLLRHAPGDEHVEPRVQVCKAEDLQGLVAADVERLHEQVGTLSAQLSAAEVYIMLQGAAKLWQSRVELCQDQENSGHAYYCNDCYKVTIESGVVDASYTLKLVTVSEELHITAWKDAAGWRIDCHSKSTNGKVEHWTYRFYGDFNEQAASMPTPCCQAVIAPNVIYIYEGVAQVALRSSYFWDELLQPRDDY